jgi:hypothetical protein
MALGLDEREDAVLKGLLQKRAAFMQANKIGIFDPAVRARAIAAVPHEKRVEIGRAAAAKLKVENRGIFAPDARKKALRKQLENMGIVPNF